MVQFEGKRDNDKKHLSIRNKYWVFGGHSPLVEFTFSVGLLAPFPIGPVPLH